MLSASRTRCSRIIFIRTAATVDEEAIGDRLLSELLAALDG